MRISYSIFLVSAFATAVHGQQSPVRAPQPPVPAKPPTATPAPRPATAPRMPRPIDDDELGLGTFERRTFGIEGQNWAARAVADSLRMSVERLRDVPLRASQQSLNLATTLARGQIAERLDAILWSSE